MRRLGICAMVKSSVEASIKKGTKKEKPFKIMKSEISYVLLCGLLSINHTMQS